MVKNHLKTIATPKTWPIKRKERIFILRPSAGPHSLDNAVSLNFLMVDMLKISKTKKETVAILHNKEVLVNGKRRKKAEFPVGLFDVITIKDIKKNYRLLLNNKGRFTVHEIESKEANIKPCKILNKSTMKDKIQLNFSDGTNMLTDNKDYKVGDSLILDYEKNAVKEHLKIEKGKTIFLIGGRHIGGLGTVEDIIGRKIIYKIKSGDIHETLKKYAFVIGNDKPIIKLEK